MGAKGAAPVTEVVHTLISEGQRQDASSGSKDIANTGSFCAAAEDGKARLLPKLFWWKTRKGVGGGGYKGRDGPQPALSPF